MTPAVYVRYCVSGHEIRFSGLCPSNCPVCGGPVDRSRRPLSLEELEARKAAEPEKAEEPKPADVAPAEASAPSAPEVSAPVRPPVRSRIPLKPAADPVGMSRPEAVPAPRQVPLQRRNAPASQAQNTPVGIALQLDFFGEPVPLPADGGWLGREGIGADCFAGNRYISRKHVFVKPDQNGRLLVQEDRSLNGVYYDQGNGKQKLVKGSTVILQEGDLLWLYNIPLRLERKRQ